MGMVLDASIVCAWALADEPHPTADTALDSLQDEAATAPWIWWFEVRNALLMNERRSRIGRTALDDFIDRLNMLPITLDQSPDEAAVIRIARAHDLSVYDAAYLELAARLRWPLATLDRKMAEGAAVLGVKLVG